MEYHEMVKNHSLNISDIESECSNEFIEQNVYLCPDINHYSNEWQWITLVMIYKEKWTRNFLANIKTDEDSQTYFAKLLWFIASTFL